MLPAFSCKIKQFLLVLIKLGVVVSAFYFIYFKLVNNNQLTWNEYERILASFSTISLLCLMIFSLFNWLFEIQKWKILAHHVSKISFNQAAAQTLAALTASLQTSYHTGDYGAKAMYYPKQCRKKIISLNLIGNMAQMAVTTILEIIGLLYIIYYFQPDFNYRSLILWLTGLGTILILLVVILRHHRLHRLKSEFNKWLMHLLDFSIRIYLKVLGYALLRYLIFSFQFYYLLLLFGVHFPQLTAFSTIASMHLLSSMLPSTFIFDVVIKGSVSLYLFGLLEVAGAVFLSVVTMMWLFNFLLPSMAGSYYVLIFRFPKPVS